MPSGYEPWRRFEADYFSGRKDEYRKEKERIARVLIEEAKRKVIRGLSSMIEVMEAATPLTNLRYTKKPQGAVYDFEQSLENSYRTRLDKKSPLKGLYFASAWTNPGGGYAPCLESGARAYKALVKDWTRRYSIAPSSLSAPSRRNGKFSVTRVLVVGFDLGVIQIQKMQ